jgi:DNA (cytosine-5)-methyltransferase 1
MVAVDLFAGLGGWTCGAAQAGVRVAWAANHWRTAVDFHAANHPATTHSCQDLHQADWSRVPRHDILLASPCCQGHARARGKDRPHHDASRSTAWAVVSCAEYHRPAVAVVENVPEFLKWSLYPAWRSAIEALGYALSENVIDAADCGGGQNRVRLFVVAMRGRTPLVLPKPAQAPTPAERFIDFGAGRWSAVVKPGRANATVARWQAGRLEHGERFVFSYYGQTRGGRSLARPIGTITTRDRWAVVDGDRMRMLSVTEARDAMGFPTTYRLPANGRVAMHLLGNAVCPPAARFVVKQLRRAL